MFVYWRLFLKMSSVLPKNSKFSLFSSSAPTLTAGLRGGWLFCAWWCQGWSCPLIIKDDTWKSTINMEVSIGKSSIICNFLGFSISTFDYRQARLCMFVFTVDLIGGMKYVKFINISSEWTHLKKKTCLEKKTCWYPLGYLSQSQLKGIRISYKSWFMVIFCFSLLPSQQISSISLVHQTSSWVSLKME